MEEGERWQKVRDGDGKIIMSCEDERKKRWRRVRDGEDDKIIMSL